MRLTKASNSNHTDIINIGVACHITAASIGGPRYDASISQVERKDHSNGMWLCQTCSKLIDSDEALFTVKKLKEWKYAAEDRAWKAILQSKPVPMVAGSKPSSRDDIRNRIRRATEKDIAGFKQFLEWPQHAIDLGLRLYGEHEAGSFTISKLPEGIELQPEISIIAPPGTGKTTTLLQLADAFLTSRRGMPVYTRLSELSISQKGLFASICARSQFEKEQITEQDLKDYAERGELVLLLDGWNEIEAAQQEEIRKELKVMRREYSRLRIVVSTRRQALNVPISGKQIEIEGLSEEQQKEFAEKNYGSSGVATVDQAWRNPSIREMIRVPLYLKVLLEGVADGEMPATKDEILALFVNKHEKAEDHAYVLHEKLCGQQRNFLIDLAVIAMKSGSTTIPEALANKSVSTTKERLTSTGQPCPTIQQNEVLDAFVDHHLLVRNADFKGFSFQHHQFQEWFASLEVEALMRATSDDDKEAHEELRKGVLNESNWEEAIFFACERVSRSDLEGVEAVSKAIQTTLFTVDPMLAAEMIFRSFSEVWDRIKQGVLDYVEKWHVSGEIDRAVRFMIMSGKEEFAEIIWPLVSDPNSQISLHALRAAPRFRPTVLGNIEDRIKTLPEESREVLLSEIASRSGADGMDLATELAKADYAGPRI